MLIDRCVAGEEQAERLFYERHHAAVYSITYRYAMDQQQAIDFLNRTFLTAFKNLEQYRGDGTNISAWLRKIAVNECISQLRIKRNQAYAELPDAFDSATEPQALLDLQMEDLIALIQSLPATQRAVFNLTAVEGLSHAEAAKRLGLREDNSRYHLRKARQSLQSLIKKLNLYP